MAGVEPVREGCLLLSRHVQIELRAAVEDVVGAAGEFLFDQPADFPLGQSAAKVPAEVRLRLRLSQQGARPRAIGAGETCQQLDRQVRMAQHEAGKIGIEVCRRNVATRQAGLLRPGFRQALEQGRKFGDGLFGKLPVGRDLAPKDGEDRRAAIGLVVQHEIPCDL